MAEHLTRKELKTDQFSLTAENAVKYLGFHRRQALQIGALALGLFVLCVGGYLWWDHARTVRADKLAEAMAVVDVPVSGAAPAQPNAPSFPNQAAKNAAETKAFSDIAAHYSGSREGAAAEYALAGLAAAAGHNDEARKRFQTAIDSGTNEYASLARLALAQLDFADNRAADGEKLLHELIDHPTAVVSSAQATVSLARMISRTRPLEARALLNPLTKETGEVGQTATTALGEIPAK